LAVRFSAFPAEAADPLGAAGSVLEIPIFLNCSALAGASGFLPLKGLIT
jgi:hypothetical protein